MHLDVDAFLASVEQVVHPELAGLPLVIGGLPSERNLVMSASYEARASGIRPGMLLAEAARRCPAAVFRRGDAQAANRLRDELTRVLCGFTPCVEVASIDDFFVDLTGQGRAQGAACATAEALRATICSVTGLPVTIGIGTNKTLARLAGKLAKPGGIGELLPGQELAFLRRLPLEHLPGAGHSIGGALERFAIRTAGELALVPREIVYASFGLPGLILHERARGIDREPVESTHVVDAAGRLVARPPRTIRRDSTFEPEEGRREIVEAMLAYLVERAAHRLRRFGLVTRTLTVRLIHVDTRPPALKLSDRPRDTEQGGASERARTLRHASDSTDELTRFAREILRELPRKRALVKRIGVTLSNFTEAQGWQGRLFDEGPTGTAPDGSPADSTGATGATRATRADRQRALDKALDALREKHGFGRILRGESFLLAKEHELGADGFRLRTPSLNQ